MCIATTSYPCPNPDADEMFQRLRNTRKVLPCDLVHLLDGNLSSCGGEIRVLHHHLGQSDFCSWCSLTAKLKYAETREGESKKRKTKTATGDEVVKQGKGETAAKKFKMSEDELMTEHDLDTGEDPLLPREATSEESQRKVVPIPRQMKGAETATREIAGQEELKKRVPCDKTTNAYIKELKECNSGRENNEEVMMTKLKTEMQKAAKGKTECLAQHTASTGVEINKNETDIQHPAQDTAKPSNAIKADAAVKNSISAFKISNTEHCLMSDYEGALSTFQKINQERVNAAKSYGNMLKEKAFLFEQNSQYQDEIARLKTTVLQLNAQYQAEIEKKAGNSKDLGREKENLEAKIGTLVQKNEGLTKAVVLANKETSTVKARARGQQNRVAELEGRVAIVKQVGDGLKKGLDEARQESEVFRRQAIEFRTKITRLEAEITRIKQEIAALGEENMRLRAAVVHGVLSYPTLQGPAPPNNSAAKSEENSTAEN